MKVKSAVIYLKPEAATEAGFQSIAFTEGQTYPELHYIVRDGMAVVNWAGPAGERHGHSVPLNDIRSVSTVA